MDSFGFCNIKAEKANARLRYRRIQKITAMFRLIELCIFMIIVSRFTTHQLPVVFKLSGEYFKGFSLTATVEAAISPRFVFIVGNVIVIVLFLKSGQLSGKIDDNSNNHRKLDFYDEYVRSCEKNHNVYIHEFEKHRKQSAAASSCCAMIKKKEVNSSAVNNLPKIKEEEEEEKKKKTMNRSHSENLKRHHHDAAAAAVRVRELRRTVTDISVDNCEKTAVSSYAEDRMSSEEFRRTVEDFIARHQRNLREEEFSVTDSFEISS